MRLRSMLLACALVPAAAQAGVWDALAGRWEGSGEVSGMAAQLTLHFQPALDGQAHRLSFRNRMRAADGKEWPFAAEAFYLCGRETTCRGHWYDTRGTTLPVSTAEQADALVVDWGDASTERGRTTYRVQDGELHITDEVRGRDGAWKVFGRSRLARASD